MSLVSCILDFLPYHAVKGIPKSYAILAFWITGSMKRLCFKHCINFNANMQEKILFSMFRRLIWWTSSMVQFFCLGRSTPPALYKAINRRHNTLIFCCISIASLLSHPFPRIQGFKPQRSVAKLHPANVSCVYFVHFTPW